MEISAYILPTLLGLIIMSILTHPKSFVWRKIPQYKTGRFQVAPSIRFDYEDKIVHFHHWFNFAILLLISAFFNVKYLDTNLAQGFLVGGIIQGLSDPMSRKLIYKKLP